jgi:hypothetical protein
MVAAAELRARAGARDDEAGWHVVVRFVNGGE